MEQENANFVSIAFMMLMGLYLIAVTLKGVFFVSASLPFFKIHPMIAGKTWLNSFLFQLSLTILASTSMVHLLVITFPQYLRGADLVLIMDEVMSGMLFVGVFMSHKVFVYIYLIMSVLGLFFSAYKIFCVNSKSEELKKIEEKRKKLFGKDRVNEPMEIEMTEMNIKDKKKETKKKPRKVKLEFV